MLVIQFCVTDYIAVTIARDYKKAMEYGAAQTGRSPRIFYADNAAEYISAPVRQLMTTSEGELRTTIPYNPEENGISERVNRTLLEGVRSVIFTEKQDDS